MKTQIIIVIISSLLIAFQGCKKASQGDSSAQTIYTNISVNSSYKFDLGFFGDEEGAGIFSQAKHHETSKLERINYDNYIYTYIPDVDFVGSDEVILSTQRGWPATNDTKYIIIKITVKGF